MPYSTSLETVYTVDETYLNLPERPGDVFIRSDKATHAVIRVRANEPVHWRRGRRRMPDYAEVELYSAGKPRSAHGNVAKLHHMVAVQEIPSRHLVQGRKGSRGSLSPSPATET